MGSLIEKDIKRFLKGKKTYLTLILIPILLVFFVGQTLNTKNPKNLPIGVVGDNEELVELIDSIGFFDLHKVTLNEGKRKLLNEKICAIIILPESEGKVRIILDRTQLITSNLADLVVDSINYDLTYLQKPYHLHREYQGENIRIFEYIMAGLLVVVAVFIGVLGGSTEIVNERRIFFRIFLFKRPISVFLEKIIFIFLITLIEIVIMLLIGLQFYNFEINNILLLILGISLLNIGSTSFGMLLSVFLKERSAYFGIMVTLFLIFFSGVLYPIILMPTMLRNLAVFTPSYYGAKVVRMCTIKETPSDILYQNVGILSGLCLAVFLFSCVVFILRAKSFAE
ncbi:MAG: ABC transporter permease [Euryarchaeota archaeon]|nr:ABC transporter permease [Euryarchaeota archaeon]